MPTILIVEDVKANAMLVSAALEELKAKHFFAANGRDAVELFGMRDDIDLILMDLHMPHMNGFDALDAIRATEQYAQRPIPIIAITANALMEEKSRFLKTTGLADYITKPIRKDLLLQTVRKHLPQPQPSPQEASKIVRLDVFQKMMSGSTG